jgi:hypothetical protein
VTFLRGSLRASSGAEAFFHDLVEKTGVNPFFFATDGESVLWGCLSSANAGNSPGRAAYYSPIMPVVQRFTQRIVAVRERLDTLYCAVNHQYGVWYDSRKRQEV